jgi:large subunit ribosomal protein L21
MYAIVEVGSKQYKVAVDEQLLVEKALTPRAHKVSFDKVLLVVKDKTVKVGQPYLKEAKVNCDVIARQKGKKKIAFKYRRRKGSQSKIGHRQQFILVKVKEIKAA